MAISLYLALVCGSQTLALTDGINYTVSPGWIPQVALDTDQPTVIESIPINILGRASLTDSADDPYIVRRNLITLTAMLRQIERGQWDEGEPVILEYTTPNSSPPMVLAAMAIRWDPSVYLPDLNLPENLVTSTVELATLTIERRSPWVVRRWVNDNLLTGSAWGTSPAPLGTKGTASWALTTGRYGGKGAMTLVKTDGEALDGLLYSSAVTVDAVNGIPIMISFALGYTAATTQVQVGFISNTTTATRSLENVTVVPFGNIATVLVEQGLRHTATLTPTATGTLRICWFASGPIGAAITVMEVMVGSADVWHLSYAETTAITAAAVAPSSTPMVVTWPTRTETRSPVDLRLFPYAKNSATRAGSGVILATSGTITTRVFPNGTATKFTTVSGANAPGAGALVLRYTPTDTTQVVIPGSSLITNARRYQLWAVVRNTSLTTSFLIQPVARSVGTSLISSAQIAGTKVLIPPQGSQTDPFIVKLGAMVVPFSIDGVELFIEASAASGALDLSMMVIVEDTDDTTAIKHAATNTTVSIDAVNVTLQLRADPRWLDDAAPTLDATSTPGLSPSIITPTATADVPLVWTRGDTLRVLWLGVSAVSWQVADASGTVVNVGMTAMRYPAFDAPV